MFAVWMNVSPRTHAPGTSRLLKVDGPAVNAFVIAADPEDRAPETTALPVTPSDASVEAPAVSAPANAALPADNALAMDTAPVLADTNSLCV